MPQMFKDEEAYPDNAQRKNVVFLGYPYTPPLAKEDYANVVADLQKELPVRFWYFLDELTTAEMMRKVWRAILRADLAVFDVSGGNPNVSFELGLAVAKDRRSMTMIKTGEPNPLGSADLGYAERMEYSSVATLKDTLRTFVLAKSSAMKILDDISYSLAPHDDSISREEILKRLTALVIHIFEKKYVTKTTARTLMGDDGLATNALNQLRSATVVKVDGARRGARWVFTDDWAYADHQVAGDI